jgi:hypothetical protein
MRNRRFSRDSGKANGKSSIAGPIPEKTVRNPALLIGFPENQREIRKRP